MQVIFFFFHIQSFLNILHLYTFQISLCESKILELHIQYAPVYSE